MKFLSDLYCQRSCEFDQQEPHASGTANSKRIPHQQLLGQEGLSLYTVPVNSPQGSIDLAVCTHAQGLKYLQLCHL